MITVEFSEYEVARGNILVTGKDNIEEKSIEEVKRDMFDRNIFAAKVIKALWKEREGIFTEQNILAQWTATAYLEHTRRNTPQNDYTETDLWIPDAYDEDIKVRYSEYKDELLNSDELFTNLRDQFAYEDAENPGEFTEVFLCFIALEQAIRDQVDEYYKDMDQVLATA